MIEAIGGDIVHADDPSAKDDRLGRRPLQCVGTH